MNFRERGVGGATKDPTFFEGSVDGMTPLTDKTVASRIAGRDLLFAAHGFNVSRSEGVCSLSRLEFALALPSSAVFIGVLWPGDFWIPVVNYPFEGATSMDCGRRLASYCDRNFGKASSLSFVTHSLGARLALEAAKTLRRQVRSMCLTAAAINNDCLTAEYASAFANSSIVSVLASEKDRVLRLAFPVGDPIANLLHFDHKPFRSAMGYRGPEQAVGNTVPPWQISDRDNYDHGDYLPSSDRTQAFPVPAGKWKNTAGYMKRTFLGSPQFWP